MDSSRPNINSAPVALLGCGAGGVQELQQHVSDDGVSWALLRWEVGSGTFARTKFVAVHFNGDDVPTVRRGKLNARSNEVLTMLGKAHATVEVKRQEELTLDLFCERLLPLLTADSGTTGSLSAAALRKDYEALLEKQKTISRQASLVSAPKTAKDHAQSKNIQITSGQALRAVGAPKGAYNWMLMEAEQLELHNAGYGGLPELKEWLAEDKVLFGLIRFAFGDVSSSTSTVVKYVFIHWVGPKVSAVKRGRWNAQQPKADAQVRSVCGTITLRKEAHEDKDLDLGDLISELRRLAVVDVEGGQSVPAASQISVEEYLAALEKERMELLQAEEEPTAAAEQKLDVAGAINSVRENGCNNWALLGIRADGGPTPVSSPAKPPGRADPSTSPRPQPGNVQPKSTPSKPPFRQFRADASPSPRPQFGTSEPKSTPFRPPLRHKTLEPPSQTPSSEIEAAAAGMHTGYKGRPSFSKRDLADAVGTASPVPSRSSSRGPSVEKSKASPVPPLKLSQTAAAELPPTAAGGEAAAAAAVRAVFSSPSTATNNVTSLKIPSPKTDNSSEKQETPTQDIATSATGSNQHSEATAHSPSQNSNLTENQSSIPQLKHPLQDSNEPRKSTSYETTTIRTSLSSPPNPTTTPQTATPTSTSSKAPYTNAATDSKADTSIPTRRASRTPETAAAALVDGIRRGSVGLTQLPSSAVKALNFEAIQGAQENGKVQSIPMLDSERSRKASPAHKMTRAMPSKQRPVRAASNVGERASPASSLRDKSGPLFIGTGWWWSKRHFQLSGATLRWWRNEDDSEREQPAGEYQLSNANSRWIIDSKKGRRFELICQTHQHGLGNAEITDRCFLAAENEAAASEWIEALEQHISYIDMLLAWPLPLEGRQGDVRHYGIQYPSTLNTRDVGT